MIPNLTIPVLNRYDLLARCLDSIDFPIGHLLIVNNGKEYPSHIEQPRTVRKLTRLDMPSNFGVSASWNLGIKSFRHHAVWFFASNDMVFGPGALEQLYAAARPDALTLTEMFPHFHAFAVGEEAIRQVGLFDENIYPAFEEDIEFLGRFGRTGLPLVKVPIATLHDNSSTINSDTRFRDANVVTHPENRRYREMKEAGLLPLVEPKWSLQRWRKHDWQ